MPPAEVESAKWIWGGEEPDANVNCETISVYVLGLIYPGLIYLAPARKKA